MESASPQWHLKLQTSCNYMNIITEIKQRRKRHKYHHLKTKIKIGFSKPTLHILAKNCHLKQFSSFTSTTKKTLNTRNLHKTPVSRHVWVIINNNFMALVGISTQPKAPDDTRTSTSLSPITQTSETRPWKSPHNLQVPAHISRSPK